MITITPELPESAANASNAIYLQVMQKAAEDYKALSGSLACDRIAFLALQPGEDGAWRAVILGTADQEVVDKIREFAERGIG